MLFSKGGCTRGLIPSLAAPRLPRRKTGSWVLNPPARIKTAGENKNLQPTENLYAIAYIRLWHKKRFGQSEFFLRNEKNLTASGFLNTLGEETELVLGMGRRGRVAMPLMMSHALKGLKQVGYLTDEMFGLQESSRSLQNSPELYLSVESACFIIKT
jgi:hypothetical protein